MKARNRKPHPKTSGVNPNRYKYSEDTGIAKERYWQRKRGELQPPPPSGALALLEQLLQPQPQPKPKR